MKTQTQKPTTKQKVQEFFDRVFNDRLVVEGDEVFFDEDNDPSLVFEDLGNMTQAAVLTAMAKELAIYRYGEPEPAAADIRRGKGDEGDEQAYLDALDGDDENPEDDGEQESQRQTRASRQQSRAGRASRKEPEPEPQRQVRAGRNAKKPEPEPEPMSARGRQARTGRGERELSAEELKQQRSGRSERVSRNAAPAKPPKGHPADDDVPPPRSGSARRKGPHSDIFEEGGD